MSEETVESGVVNNTLFVQNELQSLLPQVYNVLYPEITYNSTIPMVANQRAGAMTIAYDVFDRSGEAALHSPGAKDIPSATVGKKRYTRAVYAYSIQTTYTCMEVDSARFAKSPLEISLLQAAYHGAEKKWNKLAYFGDKDIPGESFRGFFNNQQIGGFVNGKGDFPKLLGDDKKPCGWIQALNEAGTDESRLHTVANVIANQIIYMKNTINSKSLGIENPNTLLMPLANYNALRMARLPWGNTTVLLWLKANFPEITLIPINELDFDNAKLAGNSVTPFAAKEEKDNRKLIDPKSGEKMVTSDMSGSAMFMYDRNPGKLGFYDVTPFQFKAPQLNVLDYIVPAYGTTAGTVCFYPGGMAAAFGQ